MRSKKKSQIFSYENSYTAVGGAGGSDFRGCGLCDAAGAADKLGSNLGSNLGSYLGRLAAPGRPMEETAAAAAAMAADVGGGPIKEGADVSIGGAARKCGRVEEERGRGEDKPRVFGETRGEAEKVKKSFFIL